MGTVLEALESGSLACQSLATGDDSFEGVHD